MEGRGEVKAVAVAGGVVAHVDHQAWSSSAQPRQQPHQSDVLSPSGEHHHHVAFLEKQTERQNWKFAIISSTSNNERN